MQKFLYFILVTLSSGAFGFQPLETGLQPLLERQQAIIVEQRVLNDLLQSAATQPRERAHAYRVYVEIELERRELECEVQASRRWAASPLVTYAAPVDEMPCVPPIPSPQRTTSGRR